MSDASPLNAGEGSVWLGDILRTIRDQQDADVPCGTCTACCTSIQFVAIGPDETAALAAIPPDLLFPAPGRPPGHVLLGYDRTGACPMLVEGACSIYASRPRTCRTYDCRVFAASDLSELAPPRIAAQSARWRFADEADDVPLAAVRAAGAYLVAHEDALSDFGLDTSGKGIALLAIVLHDLFIGRDADGRRMVVTPPAAEVRSELERRTA
jgi:Fe-S-cluster containining protein